MALFLRSPSWKAIVMLTSLLRHADLPSLTSRFDPFPSRLDVGLRIRVRR